jgi:site-specific recombinase XerD
MQIHGCVPGQFACNRAAGAARLLLAQGASLRTVMEQLGHSTITLTANTYSHISPALLRDAADRMEQAPGGVG